jgi:hypothetical protein
VGTEVPLFLEHGSKSTERGSGYAVRMYKATRVVEYFSASNQAHSGCSRQAAAGCSRLRAGLPRRFGFELEMAAVQLDEREWRRRRRMDGEDGRGRRT